jgi:peptide/nickel transport system substrate-binding protein
MRSDKEPFNDPRVRQAFKLAVDREALLEAVMYGNGEQGNDHPIPPFHQFYDDLGGVREQDIERARSLLAEAGYPDGIDVTLYCGNNIAPVLDVAVAYQEMAAEAGINIEISSSTRDNYLSQHWLSADFKATLWGHREDVTQLLSLAYQSDGAWNEGHYANADLDAAIRAASATRDQEARQEAFSDIQRILHDDGPTVVAFFQPFFGGTSTRIEDFYLTRNWINDFRYIRIAE